MARNARASTKVGTAAKQTSILHSNMGRISKRAAPAKSTIKQEVAEKAYDARVRQNKIEILIPTAASLAATTTTTTKKNKRKAVTIEDSEDDTPAAKKTHNNAGGSSPSKSRTVKRARRSASARTSPDNDTVITDADLPDALIEQLSSLRTSPCTTQASSPFTSSTSITSACESDLELDAPIPEALLNLRGLFAALLKTVSVHFAHNGTSNPIKMEDIYLSISQAWGKRRVTLVDCQRCLGVLNIKPKKGIFEIPSADEGSPFYICDYGRGRICIELNLDSPCGSSAFVINVDKLQAAFEKNLHTAWAARRSDNLNDFIQKLPCDPIRKSESVAKMAPINARGQQALAEFKNGIKLEQQQKQNQAASSAAAPTVNADGSKMSLLDRIRQRQQQRAQGGDVPSAAQLARQAGLQRAADVAAVIAMLSRATAVLGSPQRRISFTMFAILEKLRDSMSVTLSKEESLTTVRLLASEVAPHWLRIVAVGGRENLVVFLDQAPSAAEVEKRVGELLA